MRAEAARGTHVRTLTHVHKDTNAHTHTPHSNTNTHARTSTHLRTLHTLTRPTATPQDVEGFAAASTGGSGPSRLNAAQLARLHAVLSPFMLRRIKMDVLEVRGCLCVEKDVWLYM